MIIEFIGTPGAGKTTLLPTLVESLRERGISARSVVEAARPYAQRTFPGKVVSRLAPASLRQPLLWQVFYYLSLLYRLKFLVKNPGLIQQVLRSQRRRPIPAEARRHALYWFFRHVGYYEFLTAHAGPEEALVFDEGFIHRVVQLNASEMEEPDPARVLAYVNLLPRPDLVIFPRTPREDCEERIYQRGLWERFRHKSPAAISHYVASSHSVVQLTVDYIKSQGWTIIEVDNGGDDPAVARAELCRQLRNLPASVPERPGFRTDRGTGKVPPGTAHWVVHLPRPSRLSEYVNSRLRPLDIEFEVVGEILSQYGLDLTAPPRNLPFSRRSRNVVVDTSAGKKVLKLYRPQWQAGTVRYGHSILARLARLDSPAPRLVARPDGETFIRQADGYYALFDMVRGANYASNFLLRAHRLKLMAVAGQTLARLHRQLEGFVPEGEHHMGFRSYTAGRGRDMAWHMKKVNELKERSRSLTGPEEKLHAGWLIQNSSYILEELARLDETLSGARLPRLVIHGDYGLHNLLFRRDGTATPLDFELARLEWRLSDLVSCLSRVRYARGAYDFESIQWFLEGYQAAYPLSAEEWRYLPQVWRFYKLQAAVQYWNSYFETGGPTRKLASAQDAMGQADWARRHPELLLEFKPWAAPAWSLA